MAATKWQSCCVVQTGDGQSQVWQFESKGKRFVLRGREELPAEQPLPKKIGTKTWRTLLQPRLNIAMLPPEHVFLQVVQVPHGPLAETLSMVELQLERLSPMPVAQIVWAVHVHGPGEEGMQTVVVVMAEREAVKAHLEKLEGAAYEADRLEVSVFDRLHAIEPDGTGAWVFPEIGASGKAMVAWWSDGILSNIGFIQSPASEEDAPSVVRDQLMQMAWAGEMAGWLKAPPTWHVVAEGEVADRWAAIMRAGLEEAVEVVGSPDEATLITATVHRVTGKDAPASLLPAEHAIKYRQEFVDRLWMRGLGVAMLIYIFGVLGFYALLSFENMKLSSTQDELISMGGSYTNAIKLREQLEVLTERRDLKFAALDCWKLAAELLPEGAQLNGLTFSDGRKVVFSGTAPVDAGAKITDFWEGVRNAEVNGKRLFDPDKGVPIKQVQTPAKNSMTWNFTVELNRTEVR